MTWERAKLAIPGPAWIVVPISENYPDRLMFNDVVDLVNEGKDIESVEILDYIWGTVTGMQDLLSEDTELGQTMLPDPENPANREEYRVFHVRLYNAFKSRNGLANA